MGLKLGQKVWPDFFCLFLPSFPGTILCYKVFEMILKMPSNFPFNTDKLERSSAGQPLVHWLSSESRFDPMNGFYCFIPFQRIIVSLMFYFLELRLHLKLWLSSIILYVMEKFENKYHFSALQHKTINK